MILGINANYKALSSFQIGINNATFANTKPFHPYNAVARHGVDTVLQAWPTRLLSVRKLFGQVANLYRNFRRHLPAKG
jgi:hypothetical protein